MTKMFGITKIRKSQQNALNQNMKQLHPFKYCKSLAPDSRSLIKNIAKLEIKNDKPNVRPDVNKKLTISFFVISTITSVILRVNG